MEQVESIALVQRHENFEQKLFVLLLQRQRKPVDDAAATVTMVTVSLSTLEPAL